MSCLQHTLRFRSVYPQLFMSRFAGHKLRNSLSLQREFRQCGTQESEHAATLCFSHTCINGCR
jgi:hypothetical protein